MDALLAPGVGGINSGFKVLLRDVPWSINLSVTAFNRVTLNGSLAGGVKII